MRGHCASARPGHSCGAASYHCPPTGRQKQRAASCSHMMRDGSFTLPTLASLASGAPTGTPTASVPTGRGDTEVAPGVTGRVTCSLAPAGQPVSPSGGGVVPCSSWPRNLRTSLHRLVCWSGVSSAGEARHLCESSAREVRRVWDDALDVRILHEDFLSRVDHNYRPAVLPVDPPNSAALFAIEVRPRVESGDDGHAAIRTLLVSSGGAVIGVSDNRRPRFEAALA